MFVVAARGRLEGNHNGTLALLSGPLAPDPVLFPGCYSARSPPHPPRISPNASHILERGQRGVVGELLKLDGISTTPIPKQSKSHYFFQVLSWAVLVLKKTSASTPRPGFVVANTNTVATTTRRFFGPQNNEYMTSAKRMCVAYGKSRDAAKSRRLRELGLVLFQSKLFGPHQNTRMYHPGSWPSYRYHIGG